MHDFLTWTSEDLPSHHSSVPLRPLNHALFTRILPLGVTQRVTGPTRAEAAGAEGSSSHGPRPSIFVLKSLFSHRFADMVIDGYGLVLCSNRLQSVVAIHKIGTVWQEGKIPTDPLNCQKSVQSGQDCQTTRSS